jgi:hypothetical protein
VPVVTAGFPWSFLCHALAGIDTTICDLYDKIKEKRICELLEGKLTSITLGVQHESRHLTKGRSGKTGQAARLT